MTVLHKDPQPSEWAPPVEADGFVEDWHCIDCGVNTEPGCSTRSEIEASLRNVHTDEDELGTLRFSADSEIYIVRDSVWKKANIGGWGGCLCIGCLEKRIGRKLESQRLPSQAPIQPT